METRLRADQLSDEAEKILHSAKCQDCNLARVYFQEPPEECFAVEDVVDSQETFADALGRISRQYSDGRQHFFQPDLLAAIIARCGPVMQQLDDRHDCCQCYGSMAAVACLLGLFEYKKQQDRVQKRAGELMQVRFEITRMGLLEKVKREYSRMQQEIAALSQECDRLGEECGLREGGGGDGSQGDGVDVGGGDEEDSQPRVFMMPISQLQQPGPTPEPVDEPDHTGEDKQKTGEDKQKTLENAVGLNTLLEALETKFKEQNGELRNLKDDREAWMARQMKEVETWRKGFIKKTRDEAGQAALAQQKARHAKEMQALRTAHEEELRALRATHKETLRNEVREATTLLQDLWLNKMKKVKQRNQKEAARAQVPTPPTPFLLTPPCIPLIVCAFTHTLTQAHYSAGLAGITERSRLQLEGQKKRAQEAMAGLEREMERRHKQRVERMYDDWASQLAQNEHLRAQATKMSQVEQGLRAEVAKKTQVEQDLRAEVKRLRGQTELEIMTTPELRRLSERAGHIIHQRRVTCVVCLTNPPGFLFTGCGHQCVCGNCSPELTNCPICRTASRTIKHFPAGAMHDE